MSEINTRSMARVLLSQGRLRESLGVYREISRQTPGDRTLAAEMREVEAMLRLAEPNTGLSPVGRMRRKVLLSSILERVWTRRRSPSHWPRMPVFKAPAGEEQAISLEWIAHEKRARIIRFLGGMLDRVAARRRG